MPEGVSDEPDVSSRGLERVAVTPSGGSRLVPSNPPSATRGRPRDNKIPSLQEMVDNPALFDSLRERYRRALVALEKQQDERARWENLCEQQRRQIARLNQELNDRVQAAPKALEREKKQFIEGTLVSLGISAFTMPLVMALEQCGDCGNWERRCNRSSVA